MANSVDPDQMPHSRMQHLVWVYTVCKGLSVQYLGLVIMIFLFSDKPETFTLTFRLAENYPVDLYYLMDLSNSMKDDKEKLAALGNKIGRLLLM